MKVLDLQCLRGHVFEGWFSCEADFQGQLHDSLVQCPMCGDAHISKMLSAPRLNLGARSPGAGPSEAVAESAGQHSPGETVGVDRLDLQAAWLVMARKVLATTEDLGTEFAQEARRIHHGEAEERPIRGRASHQETLQLLDEGIAVMPLLVPDASKETLQ